MLRQRFARAAAAPIALFVGSLALRLHYRNAGLFLYDAVAIAQALERTVLTGTLQGQVHGRHGSVLVNLVAYLPVRWITGTESAEQAVLLTNIVCGSLAVVALYALAGRLLGSRSAAFFAAASYSLSPVFLSVTTYGKPHGLELLLLFGTFTFLVRAHQTGGLAELVAASALQGFAVLCREAALLFLPFYGLLYLHPRVELRWPWLSVDPRSFRPGRLVAALAPLLALVGVAWVAFLGDVVERTLAHGADTVQFFTPWSPHPALALAFRDFGTNLGALGLGLTLAGLVLVLRRRDLFPALFLCLWASYLLLFGNTPSYWPRYLAIVTPPCFVLAGLALAWLYGRSRPLGVAVFVVFASLLFLRIQPVIAYRSEVSGEKEQALWVARLVPPDALVLAMDDSIFIDYYTGLATRTHPVDDVAATERFVAGLADAIAAGTPVFVLDSAFSYDHQGIFARALLARFELELRGVRQLEDYHRSALELRLGPRKLFELRPRAAAPGPVSRLPEG